MIWLQIKFPGLAKLKLFSINVEKIWRNQIIEESLSIQNLTSLVVEGCGNLSYLFTYSMVKHLAQLEKLEISDCNFIEEIIVAQGFVKEEETERRMKVFFPKLQFLKLRGLPLLMRFCTATLVEFPSLEGLCVDNCPLLHTFVSSPIITTNEVQQGSSSSLFDEKVLSSLLLFFLSLFLLFSFGSMFVHGLRNSKMHEIYQSLLIYNAVSEHIFLGTLVNDYWMYR